MKHLLYLFFIINIITACQSTTTHLGEKFLVDKPITVDAVLEQLKSNSTLKNIQIEGKIAKSCMSEGCWFTISDVSGNEILFNVKDKKFRVPINSPGKNVVVLADAQANTDTTNTKDTPTYELSVRGLLFK